MIEIGKKAPDFKLNDQDGNPVSLNNFKGKYLISDRSPESSGFL